MPARNSALKARSTSCSRSSTTYSKQQPFSSTKLWNKALSPSSVPKRARPRPPAPQRPSTAPSRAWGTAGLRLLLSAGAGAILTRKAVKAEVDGAWSGAVVDPMAPGSSEGPPAVVAARTRGGWASRDGASSCSGRLRSGPAELEGGKREGEGRGERAGKGEGEGRGKGEGKWAGEGRGEGRKGQVKGRSKGVGEGTGEGRGKGTSGGAGEGTGRGEREGRRGHVRSQVKG